MAPLLLDALLTADLSDADLVAAAVPYFCRALDISLPAQVEFELPGQRVPVLVLHAAALVAALRFQHDPAASLRVVVGEGVLDELLMHEARYWRGAAQAAGFPAEGALIKPVVAAAALVGAGTLAEAATVVARVRTWRVFPWASSGNGRDGYTACIPPERTAAWDRCSLTCWQRSMWSNNSLVIMVWPDHVCGFDRGTGLAHVDSLARACAHQDLPRTSSPRLFMMSSLISAVAAAQVALQTPGDLGMRLADALQDAPASPEFLAEIVETLPYPSVVLAHAHLAATLRLRAGLSPETEPEDAALWSQRAGMLLRQLGRAREALSAAEEAVSTYRQLAEASPGKYRVGLAVCLDNLGVLYSDLGRPREALSAAEEAVSIYRALAGTMPEEQYHFGLAAALDNLGSRYSDLGCPQEALAPAEEAVAIRRELAEALPDRHRGEALAGS